MEDVDQYMFWLSQQTQNICITFAQSRPNVFFTTHVFLIDYFKNVNNLTLQE